MFLPPGPPQFSAAAFSSSCRLEILLRSTLQLSNLPKTTSMPQHLCVGKKKKLVDPGYVFKEIKSYFSSIFDMGNKTKLRVKRVTQPTVFYCGLSRFLQHTSALVVKAFFFNPQCSRNSCSHLKRVIWMTLYY